MGIFDSHQERNKPSRLKYHLLSFIVCVPLALYNYIHNNSLHHVAFRKHSRTLHHCSLPIIYMQTLVHHVYLLINAFQILHYTPHSTPLKTMFRETSKLVWILHYTLNNRWQQTWNLECEVQTTIMFRKMLREWRTPEVSSVLVYYVCVL